MDEIPFNLEVVSGVKSLYSGKVKAMRITGSEGEMGIRHGHTPLLTTIKAGMVLLVTPDNQEDQIYLAGGILEVQPDSVTVLADTALRAEDIDEAKAQEAIRSAKQVMQGHTAGDKDYTAAFAELAEAMAKIKVLQLARSRRR